ncbi:PhoPQ-activated pathogenicity-related family protein [Endozoicomonas gorgoniicola]|uniref:PhoPQ-activated pathogenicity-related family protein n=1 Tax=Endozoicomonas gorgoniicola TaxID=1234144 RepID=A0ABT3N299_9GAMM|nr:PhoPQ-activated pathogenicity-related family protein [Endozoicomonas gorgoniicola]MCW7555760.1 PhoPQ-activated pathogenicity-related family protein [Endozoicomonas gorgoniicola]
MNIFCLQGFDLSVYEKVLCCPDNIQTTSQERNHQSLPGVGRNLFHKNYQWTAMMNPVLSDFLALPEPHFQWTVLAEECLEGEVRAVQLELTSLTWPKDKTSGADHQQWQHRLHLYLPAKDNHQPCLLMINSGTRHDLSMETTPQSQVDSAALCRLTGAPVASLKDIPNQPITFADGKPRSEDDLVAWSWKQFLENPEANRFYPLQWPMVKAVVKAMDVIEAFTATQNTEVNDFILSGGSKRGWVSWLTASADFRVASVIPIVIDVLNIEACIHHHHNVYNGWSPAIKDYTDEDHNILEALESETAQQLLELIDPIHCKESLQLPKFVINASGDEFFPPDSARFYYHQLSQPKWLRYLPNCSHYPGREANINTTELMASAYGALLADSAPVMSWQPLDDGGIELRLSEEPGQASVWFCHNPLARDFRRDELKQQGLRFNSQPLKPVSTSPWVYRFLPEPADKGWTAFFIEASFDNPPFPNLKLTSGIRVLPDIYQNPS